MSTISKSSFNISTWAIQHVGLTRFLFALLLLSGVFAVTHMGQKEDPDFTFRVMLVQAVWPGASLQEMQDQVVDKIERKLQETPHLDFVKSFTRAGSTVITVNIKGSAVGRDVTDAFYQVRKKVGDIAGDLPQGLMGPYFNDEFGDTFISLYAFTGDGFSSPELEKFAKNARDVALRVEGIEKIQILGAQDEKIFVDISTQTLAERRLTMSDIANALASQSGVDPSGHIETAERSVRLAVDGGIRSTDDIAALRLKIGGATIQLGDIATITRGTIDPPDRIHRYNGKDAVILGMVMAKGFNVTSVGDELHKVMKEVQKSLPIGGEVHQISDQPEIVKHSITEFVEALGEALGIVLIVSFISIGWRAGLVVAFTIPLVLAATFAVMYMMGIDLQRISLGALIIALGLLVDDAMIAVEMMERKLEEGLPKLNAAGFAYTSTAFPMLTGTLITTAGFIPVGFAASTAGEYVSSMFWVVGLALVLSWFAAVYFTPWLGSMLLRERKHEGGHRDIYDTRFYRGLWNIIAFAVKNRILVIVLTLAAFGAAGFAMKFIPKSFFPASTRLEVLVDLWLPEGTSIKETSLQTKALEQRVLADPDQAFVASFVGEGAPRFYLPLDQQQRNPNFAQLLIVAKNIDARDRLMEKIRQWLGQDFPSIRYKVDRLFNGPPVGWPVQIRVGGPDRHEVRRIADQIKAQFATDPRISSINDDWAEPVPSLQLVIDQDRARALGVSSQRIRQTLQAALSGYPIGTFRDGEQTIAIVLREEEKNRSLLSAVAQTYVTTDTGANIPISQIAKLVPMIESGIEWRRNRLATITVRGIIPNGIEPNDVTLDMLAQLEPLKASLPLGYTIEPQGGVEESATSQNSIAAKAPVMVIIMLVLLMLQLQHFGKAMLVFVTAPLGLIGAAAALLLTNSAFGFVAILGVIALAGIIMRNSIILIDQIDQDREAGHTPWEATVGSAVRRFRPIMLTAAAAVLALIPIAQSAFWGPMAYAMMGGILAATVLTLLFLPAAYALFFWVKVPEPGKRGMPKSNAPGEQHPAPIESALSQSA
jgi:multidrug efflux pump